MTKKIIQFQYVMSMTLVAFFLTTTLKASSELCPCIRDYPPFVNVSDDCAYITTNNQQYCYNRSYGLKTCQQWDKGLVPYCQNNEQSFCNLPWCYVDGSNCSIAKKDSLYFPGVNLQYSYATCGVLDSWHIDHMASSLQGKTVRVAAMNNTGGYSGAYFVDDEDYFTVDGHRGPTWDFFLELSNVMGFEIELVGVSQISLKAENITKGSNFTAAVHDIALGYVDIGVGLFAQTPQRHQLAFFTPTVYVEFMYLATFFDSGIDHGSITTMFEPFSRDLWILLLFIVVIIYVLLLVIEGMDTNKGSRHLVQRDSLLDLAKWGAGSGQLDSFKTWQSKFLLCGVGVFSLITINCYTANLTVYLSQVSDKREEYESVLDVIRNGEKICTLHAYGQLMKAKFNLKDEHFNLSQSRSELPKLMSDGHCGAAIMEQGDLEVFHSNGTWCNITLSDAPVFTLSKGFPVSREMAEVFSYWVTLLKIKGTFNEKLMMAKPPSVCAANNKTEILSSGLTVEQFLGPTILLSSFAVIAIFAKIGEIFYRSKKQSKGKKTGPFQTVENQAIEVLGTEILRSATDLDL